MERHQKTFKLQLERKSGTVSTDRLKAAHTEQDFAKVSQKSPETSVLMKIASTAVQPENSNSTPVHPENCNQSSDQTIITGQSSDQTIITGQSSDQVESPHQKGPTACTTQTLGRKGPKTVRFQAHNEKIRSQPFCTRLGRISKPRFQQQP